MKNIFIYFLSITIGFSQKTSNSFKQENNNKYRSAVEYTFDDIPDNGSYSCIISGLKGDINVLGHPGSGIHLIIDRVVRALNNKNAINILERNQIQVFHIEDDKAVEIKGLSHRYENKIQSYFIIHLPFNTNITIESKGGDIHIRKIRGRIELGTKGGDIELEQLSGTIDAHTDGGDIQVDQNDGVLNLHTLGGNIDITQSKGNFNASIFAGDLNLVQLKGNVKATLIGGTINLESIDGDTLTCNITGGDLTGQNLNSSLIAWIKGGDVDLKNIRGNINVSTSVGNIELESIYGSISCITSSGGIHGNNLFGAIKAFTSEGNIEVEKSYHSSLKDHTIDIETSDGEITIVIPNGLPVAIDAEVMGMFSRDAITSDIPLEEKKKLNRISGTGIIKNGVIPCSIKSSNGSITIKKN